MQDWRGSWHRFSKIIFEDCKKNQTKSKDYKVNMWSTTGKFVQPKITVISLSSKSHPSKTNLNCCQKDKDSSNSKMKGFKAV